jgi:hypothetical protein
MRPRWGSPGVVSADCSSDLSGPSAKADGKHVIKPLHATAKDHRQSRAIDNKSWSTRCVD